MVQISTPAGIASLALSALGKSTEIQNLTTDSTEEGNAIKRFFDNALEEILRGWPWPFATRYQVLTKIQEQPTPEWAFSYRYPPDCLDARRILSGLRKDNAQTRVNFWIGADPDGRLILTDRAEACLEYTFNPPIIAHWPPDFKQGFAYLLAFYTAPRLTGGDPFELQQRLVRLALQKLEEAAAKSFNEQQEDVIEDSEFTRARGPGPFGNLRRTFRIAPF